MRGARRDSGAADTPPLTLVAFAELLIREVGIDPHAARDPRELEELRLDSLQAFEASILIDERVGRPAPAPDEPALSTVGDAYQLYLLAMG
jgi:acyl carrier protein